MGPVSFHTFINNKDKRIECIFDRFADDSRLSGVVGTPEGWDTSRGTWIGLRNGPIAIL